MNRRKFLGRLGLGVAGAFVTANIVDQTIENPFDKEALELRIKQDEEYGLKIAKEIEAEWRKVQIQQPFFFKDGKLQVEDSRAEFLREHPMSKKEAFELRKNDYIYDDKGKPVGVCVDGKTKEIVRVGEVHLNDGRTFYYTPWKLLQDPNLISNI